MLDAAISGVLAGAAFAMLGVCIVFMFSMVRVLNFAQAAIGTAGTFVTIVLSENGWSFIPAAAVGIAFAVVLGVAFGFVMAYAFGNASVEARSTVGITMLIATVTAGTWIFGTDPRPIPELLPNSSVEVGSIAVSASTIVTLVVSIALAVGVTAVLKYTRFGVRLRAMSERPDAAELLGVPSQRFTIGVWGVAAAIAAFAVLMAAPTRQSDFTALSFQLLLPAVAAASLGLLRSLTGAVIGGLLIGVLQGIVTNYPSIAAYADAIPLIVILMVLLWTQRAEVWDVAR